MRLIKLLTNYSTFRLNITNFCVAFVINFIIVVKVLQSRISILIPSFRFTY